MAVSDSQRRYINDLVVSKTKEFKEIKPMLVANGIVSKDAATVMNADSLAAILDAIDQNQASRMIEMLIAKEAPKRGSFSDKQVTKMSDRLASILDTIDDWDFETLGDV